MILSILPGFVSAAEDTRTPVYLSEDRRVEVLAEMRGFLEGVNGIMGALAGRDMKAVAKIARANGRQQMRTQRQQSGRRGPGFEAPQAFRVMAQTLHDAFDQIALDAESMGDPQLTMEQLSTATATCTACHASYRLVAQ